VSTRAERNGTRLAKHLGEVWRLVGELHGAVSAGQHGLAQRRLGKLLAAGGALAEALAAAAGAPADGRRRRG
jgi:hypothetical protein